MNLVSESLRHYIEETTKLRERGGKMKEKMSPFERWWQRTMGGGNVVRSEVQVDIRLTPRVERKRSCFNSFKVHPFQAIGFKYQPARPYSVA